VRRAGIFVYNLAVGALGGTAFGLLVRHFALEGQAVWRAFLGFGLTGMVVGLTVAIGATVGPRPPLGVARCILAQGLVAVTSAAGAFVGAHFPQFFSSVDHAVRDTLARRGLVVGSWLGAALGTAVEIIHIYRSRHRADPPP
jgi:hypothetical protein